MLDRTYIRFRFKISLHIDDLEVLNVIKSNLNIGKIIVEEKRNSCAFVVQSFSPSVQDPGALGPGSEGRTKRCFLATA